MKITVGVRNLVMYPENDAEVYQLEGIKQQLESLAMAYDEVRHWEILSLKIPLKDKNHDI